MSEPISTSEAMTGIVGLIIIAIIIAVVVSVCRAISSSYTKEDCIRQWREAGVYANAAEYCADYD